MKFSIYTKLAILALISYVLLSFLPKNKTPQNINKNAVTDVYKNISPLEFDRIISKNNIFLVDVHVPEQNHLPNTDLFVPFDKINENINKFPKDKTTPIIVYCRSGNMSIEASTELIKLGYKNVSNLAGGINAYRESHYGIFIQPKTKDLGTVIYGDVAKTTFDLTNNTKETVKITKVTTSCGCTKAVVGTEELKPFDTAKVTVSFDPAVHKDDTDLGDITRTIFIETNHPNFKKIESTITAKVVKK